MVEGRGGKRGGREEGRGEKGGGERTVPGGGEGGRERRETAFAGINLFNIIKEKNRREKKKEIKNKQHT